MKKTKLVGLAMVAGLLLFVFGSAFAMAPAQTKTTRALSNNQLRQLHGAAGARFPHAMVSPRLGQEPPSIREGCTCLCKVPTTGFTRIA